MPMDEIQSNPVSPIPVVTPTRTFRDMANVLINPDVVALSDPNFDPAVFIGDVRDKVDGIHHIAEVRMKGVAEHLKAEAMHFADPLLKAAKAVLSNRDRLLAYVADSMLGKFAPTGEPQRLEQMPGHLWRVRLQDNQPAMQITMPPSAALMEQYPDLIEMERSYCWKTDAVKDRLKSLMSVEDEEKLSRGIAFKHESMPFAILTQGHHVRFYPHVPDDIKPSKRSKIKKGKAS